MRLYHNARVIDADQDFIGYVGVKDGKIAAVGKGRPDALTPGESVDAGGHCLMPAFVDLHCHLRDPGFPQKETLETGLRAAVKGGYGTVVAMANTNPVIETPEQVTANQERAAALSLATLIQAAAAGIGLHDERPTDYEALARVTPVLTNDGLTIFQDGFMERLLRASGAYGFLISTHCQPERKIVARDLRLLQKTEGRLHVGHVSRQESLGFIREAKAQGQSLTCEVTPHHLIAHDLDYRVNPPIRTKRDNDAMLEGILDGTIDVLATDHAPHTQEDKQNGMAGISCIEYAPLLFLSVFLQHGISLCRFSEMIAKTPSALLGLNKGRIRVGYDADLVLIDLDDTSVLDASRMISRSHNTPFDQARLNGRVLNTIAGGNIVYEH